MVPKRIHIRVMSAIIILLGLSELVMQIVNLISLITSGPSSFRPEDYLFMLSNIAVAAIVTGAIRTIFKPYKYWMDMACNAFALGMFSFMVLRGGGALISYFINHSSTMIPFAVINLFFGVMFFILGIIASKMVIKRRRPAGFFYMGIVVGGTLIYLMTFFGMHVNMSGSSLLVNIPFIVFLGLESAFAVINAFTVETPSELDSFLNSIERRHPRLYKMIVKAYSGKVNTANNQVAPGVQDQATDVEETDEFVERTWTERGMVFSNKE